MAPIPNQVGGLHCQPLFLFIFIWGVLEWKGLIILFIQKKVMGSDFMENGCVVVEIEVWVLFCGKLDLGAFQFGQN